MRLILYILFTSFLYTSLSAQDYRGTKTIIHDINTSKAGQGTVRVMQDETIDKVLAQYNFNNDTSSVIRLSNERINGYKIQVFSGNNQNESRRLAESRQSLVRSEFPQHQVLVTYDSPSWRLRVGNFLTQAEAETVIEEMKRKFPDFGKEMYIVSDIIRRPLR